MVREQFVKVSRSFATATLVAGLVALASWLAPDPRWRGLMLFGTGVNPLSALSLALLGTSVLLLMQAAPSRAGRALAFLLAGVVVALGASRMGVALSLWSVRLDLLWVPGPASPFGSARMASGTGLCCVLLGTAVLSLGLPSRRLALVREGLAVASLTVATVGLFGYLYGSSAMYGRMALVTAAALLSMSLAVLWAWPPSHAARVLAQPGPAGDLLRRLMPWLLVFPAVLGWVQLAGERSGWFDDPGGIALIVTLATLGLVGMKIWNAGRLGVAERALAESEERHRELFQASPVPAWVYDHDSLRFLAVNQAAIRHYGYTREEFMGMTLADIRPAEEVPKLREFTSHSDPADAFAGVWRHRCKDGRLIDVEIVRREVRYRDRPARLALATDVTERLRTEARLRESEERFRALAITANDAILSADSTGAITYANPAAERMFGHEEGTLLGRDLTVLMPLSYRDRHRRGMERYLQSGQGRVVGRTIELVGLRATGEEFPIELSLASWRHDGEVAFTAIIRDVTLRRRADDALQRYASELSVANQELDAFAYSVSHDLRAPLRSIDGFSQALAEDFAPQLNDEGQMHLKRIRRAAQKMGSLIDDLLVLSRLTRTPMQPTLVDVSALAVAACEELSANEPHRAVKWQVASGMRARGDGRLLKVAMENLLANAWKYTRHTDVPRVTVGWRRDGGQTEFFVEDNGAGFDMQYVGKLFVPFQRLHSEAEFEGTGIGLATVARVVHRHGGRVWAHGEPGRGASFSFSLEAPVTEEVTA